MEDKALSHSMTTNKMPNRETLPIQMVTGPIFLWTRPLGSRISGMMNWLQVCRVPPNENTWAPSLQMYLLFPIGPISCFCCSALLSLMPLFESFYSQMGSYLLATPCPFSCPSHGHLSSPHGSLPGESVHQVPHRRAHCLLPCHQLHSCPGVITAVPSPLAWV